ncbi:AIM24 family protein [Streptomyces sp. V2]|uniref:AIM24 family protein n=1 Tax=Streptomyces niveiscabiei TaxID=164115 RepID=A0ABW9HSJ2_9ACTN|nr:MULTISPECIES: AIM24 family protein [unclassified Streptomyces]PWG07058.1 AIM24 family protein [Streptomyces sp. V2]QZZ30090.1 AIM24 family protein [Streptomyces sp. ST1015]
MHSTLFAHIPVESTERYTLQNPQLLKTDVSRGRGAILARQGAMVAFEGDVQFDSQYRDRGWRNVERMTGERLELMRCKGSGVVYLANFAQHLHIMEVGRGITVDSSSVLAFDGSLKVGIVAIDSAVEVASAGAYNLELSGDGQVVVMTSGEPLVLEVGPGKNVCCDSDAVIAWSTSLRTQLQAPTSTSAVWRRRGSSGEGWEMQFSGTGHVLVQPSELLPPQHLRTSGVLGQFGMGSGGLSGNSLGGSRS